PQLEQIDGFLSVERFRNVKQPGWLLSLSLWRDEAALVRWREHGEHHAVQTAGRESIFHDYRIRVARMGEALACAAPLVGLREVPNGDALPNGDELRSGDDASEGSLYESLTTPGKRILLRDFDKLQDAVTWQQHAGAGALCGEIIRDY